MEIIVLQGAQAKDHLEELGQLRITVFREYPYLYEGNMAYETKYLERYFSSDASMVAVVFDQNKIVGASTAIHLIDEESFVKDTFVAHGYRPEEVVYFGESILLPKYRGEGIGRRFFEFREAFALSIDPCVYTSFCAVSRELDHPKRPEGYRDLSEFWTKCGYEKCSAMVGTFSWQEIGEDQETPKTMQYWIKNHESTK